MSGIVDDLESLSISINLIARTIFIKNEATNTRNPIKPILKTMSKKPL